MPIGKDSMVGLFNRKADRQSPEHSNYKGVIFYYSHAWPLIIYLTGVFCSEPKRHASVHLDKNAKQKPSDSANRFIIYSLSPPGADRLSQNNLPSRL